jgi:hypothetical protein
MIALSPCWLYARGGWTVETMEKVTPEHKDKLGRPINLDDCVVFPRSNSLYLGKVVKLNPKMIGVEELDNKKQWKYSGNKYPQDCALVDPHDVTLYILKS